jgi:DNA polymerase Ligase (LigD)
MFPPSGRFVILEHDHPHRHWDFMLEADGALRTWRLPTPPADGLTVTAERIADHRLAYLDHDGPVSGNRGVARPWDQGNYASAEEGTVVLTGRRWSGQVRMRPAHGSLWSFEFVGG